MDSSYQSLCRDFLRAAKNESVLALRKIHTQNPKVIDAVNTMGANALIIAVKKRRIENIKNLIKFSVNKGQQDNAGYTALMYAAKKGNVEIVNLLINPPSGEKVNAQELSEQKVDMALKLAVQFKHIDVVHILTFYQREANPNGVESEGYTSLMHAAASESLPKPNPNSETPSILAIIEQFKKEWAEHPSQLKFGTSIITPPFHPPLQKENISPEYSSELTMSSIFDGVKVFGLSPNAPVFVPKLKSNEPMRTERVRQNQNDWHSDEKPTHNIHQKQYPNEFHENRLLIAIGQGFPTRMPKVDIVKKPSLNSDGKQNCTPLKRGKKIKKKP